MLYKDLVTVYEEVSSTSKRLEKTFFISKLLEQTAQKELPDIILLLQGRIFPIWDDRKIGVAAQLVQKAIALATGADAKKITQLWKETGDLGKVAQELCAKKKQATLFSQELTVEEVLKTIRKLSTIEGAKSVDIKLKLIAGLLTNAAPSEARFIVRTVLEDLRVGAGEGVMRDALTWAFTPKVLGILVPSPKAKTLVPNAKTCLITGDELDFKYQDLVDAVMKTEQYELITDLKDGQHATEKQLLFIPQGKDHARETQNHLFTQVQEAFDITNDFGKVAQILKEKGLAGLDELSIEAGQPLNLMLYPKANSVEDAFEIVGAPAAVEDKYDGFRAEIHKEGDEIKIYTRRLEEVTERFPDVVAVIKKQVKTKSCILDGEVVGIDKKTKKMLPFQHISKRIRRKYEIEKISKEIPVVFQIFDILLHDGKNLIKEPFQTRRDLLKKIIEEEEDSIQLARQIVTSSVKEAEDFYQQALKAGNEGIMMKSLDGIYKPGKRVGYGVKVKPVMETLDLVIVAAEWGKGKRSGSLTSFTLACQDEDGNLLEIGNLSTGLKEKVTEEGDITYEYMTNLLKEEMEAEEGTRMLVRPSVVIEVHYEEIQKSPTNSSGYALRFPRFVRLREDRSAHEISDISLVEDLYAGQRNR